MPEPDIIRVAEEFRRRLLARERAAAVELLRAYGAIWRRLREEINALALEVQAMREAGEEVSRGRLAKLDRLQRLREQLKREMAEYVRYVDADLQRRIREMVRLGEQDAYQLMLSGMPEAARLAVEFHRLPDEAIQAMVGTLQEGSPLRALLVEAVGEAADAFGETLLHGLAMGWNPTKLARRLRKEFGMGLTRALRIARTEQLRAYHLGTLHQYQESGVVKGWRRLAAKNERTCLACLMLDGKVYALDEPMDDHPNGRCTMVPILEHIEVTWQSGRDWFLAQPEDVQRRMMGEGLFAAWKAGKVNLEDLPKLVTNEKWGNHWTVKSLKELGV